MKQLKELPEHFNNPIAISCFFITFDFKQKLSV